MENNIIRIQTWIQFSKTRLIFHHCSLVLNYIYINILALLLKCLVPIIFFLLFLELPYGHIGCFKDSIPRASDSLEGKSLILTEHYKRRTDAIKKCYDAAIKLGYNTFAVQDGGQCFSSKTADVTYNKYGSSSDCGSDKKGGPMANDVYKIITSKSKAY